MTQRGQSALVHPQAASEEHAVRLEVVHQMQRIASSRARAGKWLGLDERLRTAVELLALAQESGDGAMAAEVAAEGFTVTESKAAGYSAVELKVGGYSAQECKEVDVSAMEAGVRYSLLLFFYN